MAETLIDRAWSWLHATFPERQIYVRSEGRVQFFTFGSALQATCAGLALIFLGWVAFASVNVIFKDRIIATKDHRYQQMQSTYENRVADLQLSYDQLNDALISAEDRFKSTADELEAKQRSAEKLVSEKQYIDAVVTNTSLQTNEEIIPRASQANSRASESLGAGEAAVPAADNFAISSPPPPAAIYSGNGSSQLTIMPEPVEPQPRTAKPSEASLLDNSLTRFAETLFRPPSPNPRVTTSGAPALRMLTLQTDRLKRLGDTETALVAGIDRSISARVDKVRGLLGRVGLSSTTLARDQGIGGPLVPMQSVLIEGVADPSFTDAYESAIAHRSELSSLLSALHHVPLTTPVHGPQFEITSGFGPRVDPFTSRIAFHTGMDFAGPWGSTVVATAPGVVVWSGARAGYGNMVEIDHGLGFRTRYGHLASTLVRPGMRVRKGTPIGRLGSTGRSTGPHVHYEVWLANAVRDPSRYIEAGRHGSD